MKAAVLQKDRTLVIQHLPIPELVSRSALVKVMAVQLPAYTCDIVSGALNYPHGEPPVVLGGSGVGEVVSIADDVHDVHPGDIVYCDPVVGHHSNNGDDDFILQGIIAPTPESVATQKKYSSGTFAEQFVTPVECLTVIRRPELATLAQWATLLWFSIAHGALVRGDFQAGQVVAVSGASGGIGGCAVLLALAGGASKVLAIGRNTAALQRLVSLDPARVVAVVIKPDQPPLEALIPALGKAQVDLAVDSLGRADNPDTTLACLTSLKKRGIMVLVGSMVCPLPIPHGDVMRRELEIRGSYMSSRATPGTLIRLVESGVLDLGLLDIKTCPLAEITKCINEARKCSALQFSVLLPSS